MNDQDRIIRKTISNTAFTGYEFQLKRMHGQRLLIQLYVAEYGCHNEQVCTKQDIYTV